MVALDWIFLAVLVVSMLVGAWRGLVFEVLSLLGWVASFFIAQWFAPDLAVRLPMGDSAPTLRYAAGFVIAFVLSVFVCGLMTWIVKKLIEAVGLRPVDRTLGAMFGVLRGFVLLLAMAMVARLTPVGSAPWWQESWAAPFLAEMLRGLRPALPEELGKYLSP